ncbi:MAG: FAD-binding oxidoreductase [Acidimicrobiales bacterium]|nr:FAD-binding oxidoreductase [Acidimicrobiales bacterium]
MTTKPTSPIDFSLPYEEVKSRFQASTTVTISKEVMDQLLLSGVEIITDKAALSEAGRDWWPISLQWAINGMTTASPLVILKPTETKQVSSILKICNDNAIPVTPVAGRSGVVGGSVPLLGGISLDLTAMSGIEDVDETSLVVRVKAGTFGPDFEAELRENYHLTLGHFPQSMDLSTVGGWVACRGAGQYSTRYGKIEDMVVGLEVVLANGEIITTGGLAPRSAVGPDLTAIFVGSEGTLGVITSVVLKVHPLPNYEKRAAYGFPTFQAGLESCRKILQRGATPAVLRLYDAAESNRHFGTGETNALVVLDEGDPKIVDATMEIVESECHNALDLGLEPVAKWVESKNDVKALASLTKIGITLDTIEIAGRWSALPRLYQDAIEEILAIPGALVASAHQSHAYLDGACIYFTFVGKINPSEHGVQENSEEALKLNEAFYRQAWDSVMSVINRHGASISHHHGIGINRARYVKENLGAAFGVLEDLKNTLDPVGILNPLKLGFSSKLGSVDLS